MRPSHRSTFDPIARVDEAEEAREHAAFMRTLDPALAAAANWHTRREEGFGTAEDAAFRQWLAADPAHARAYAQVEQSDAQVRQLPAKAVASLRAPPPSRRLVATPRRNVAWRFPRPAALAAACLLFAGVAGLVGWHQWRQPMYTHQYATDRGQRLDAALPDGSQMTLDASTHTSVALYRDRREVQLREGQAMFVVAPDADKPFHVVAGPARITVTGTRFSVRYTGVAGQPGAVEVAVEEGQINVQGAIRVQDGGPAATLTAGQTVQVGAAGALGPVTAVPVGSVALWRKGLVRFSDTPLAEAIREMERYGPTGLVVRAPQIANLRIGGSFAIARPQDLAKVLPSILPVRLVPGPSGQQEVVSKP
jgi:transmembrane sensor